MKASGDWGYVSASRGCFNSNVVDGRLLVSILEARGASKGWGLGGV